MPKKYKSRRYFQIAVHGVKYRNDGMDMTRLDWIRKYVQYGSRFALEREPDNEHDKNAIKIKHILKKSGRKITVGYVPRKEAAEWAPIMDEYHWDPEVFFGMKLCVETEEQAEKKDMPIGTVYGLLVRIATR